jgi:flagellar hook-length control protein FliK
MSSRALDALFSPAPPVRAVEPQRAEGAAPFAPVLDRALRTSDAAPDHADDSADDEPLTADASALEVDGDGAGAESGEAPAEVAVDEHGEEQADDASRDERDEDDVVISAEAAEAAQATAAAAVVEAVPATVDGEAAADSTDGAIEAAAQSGNQQPKPATPTPEATPTDDSQGEIDGAAPADAAGQIPSTEDDATQQTATVQPAKLTRSDLPAKTAPRRAEAPTADGNSAKRSPRATVQAVEEPAVAATDPSAEAKAADDGEQDGETLGVNAATEETNAAGPQATPTRTEPNPTNPTDVATAAPADAAAPVAPETSRDANATPTADVNIAATAQPANDNSTTPRGAAALARLAAERSLHTADSRGADDGSPVDRARFVGRVEGAMRAAQQRDGRIHVRLSPPELGSLRIELTIQQGALAARLEAETPAARNLLLDNLPALRERLAQQDIRVERFDVDLRQDFNTGGGANQHESQDRMARETNWRPGAPRQARGGASASPQAPTPRGAGGASNAALDVRV